MEKELLSVIFGLERFHQYTYGRTVQADTLSRAYLKDLGLPNDNESDIEGVHTCSAPCRYQNREFLKGTGYDYPDLPGLGNNNEKLGLPERLSTGIQFHSGSGTYFTEKNRVIVILFVRMGDTKQSRLESTTEITQNKHVKVLHYFVDDIK